jgi:hypothetical protein
MTCLPVFVFVYEGQITQPPTVTAGEVVTERKFGYLCSVVNWTGAIMMPSMPGEEKDRVGAFDEVCFYVSNVCRKHFR